MSGLQVQRGALAEHAERRTKAPLQSLEERAAAAADAAQGFAGWCKAQGFRPETRGPNLLSPGSDVHACVPPDADPVAAMRIFAWKREDGVIGISFDHWYGAHLRQAVASERARMTREIELASTAEARRAERQREGKEQAERRRAAQERRDTMARALADKAMPGCGAFERRSNALHTRFDVGLTLEEFRRHVSDLAVDYEDCKAARPTPHADRRWAQHLTMRSWRLTLDLWMHADRMCRPNGCGPDWPWVVSTDRAKLVDLYREYAELMPLPVPITLPALLAGTAKFPQ
jgi:hypothetical protein